MDARKQRLATQAIEAAVEAAEAGHLAVAEEALRRVVHAGVSATELVFTALAAEAVMVREVARPQGAPMLVTYNGPDPDGVTLAPAWGGVHFPHGVPVEVDDELGRMLVEQTDFRVARKRRDADPS